jgi:hypothetical protein
MMSTMCSKHVESCKQKYIEKNLWITLVIYQESFIFLLFAFVLNTLTVTKVRPRTGHEDTEIA